MTSPLAVYHSHWCPEIVFEDEANLDDGLKQTRTCITANVCYFNMKLLFFFIFQTSTKLKKKLWLFETVISSLANQSRPITIGAPFIHCNLRSVKKFTLYFSALFQ